MLHICNDILSFSAFYEHFRTTHENKKCIDLSKVFSWDLANEADSIVTHHKDCVIFLGYLEPGFMLDSPSQTRLRKLFRNFEVAMITNYSVSLPHSWKTEVATIYTNNSITKNGDANVINNGGAV